MDTNIAAPDQNIADIRAALEHFVIENSELERLEDSLSEVNLFEALGAVRSEHRHSDFLAFLLDPSQSHGLGDLILKRVVQNAVADFVSETNLPSAVDLDGWDLDDTLVWRERDNIDLLMVNERLKLMILIQNKVDSKEHSKQLTRYRKTVEARYSDYKRVFLFLTVDGDAPSDDAYISITHAKICAIVQRILDSRSSRIGQDVEILLRHYCRMIRRHFMEDAELARLAKSIYQRHRVALEYIFEQRPDLQSWISELVQDKIKETPALVLDRTTKTIINFAALEWDQISRLTGSKGWTYSGRLLMFEFRNDGNRLQLALIIGPGQTDSHDSVRRALFEEAAQNQEAFNLTSRTLYPKWCQIWSRSFLTKRDLEEGDNESNKDKIDKTWAVFLQKDFPRIANAVARVSR